MSVLGTAGFCLPTGCLILNRCTCCLVPSGLGILPSPAISPVLAPPPPPHPPTSHYQTAPFRRAYVCVRVCRLRSRRCCIIMAVSAVPPAHHFTRMPASDIDPPSDLPPPTFSGRHTRGRAVCIFPLLDVGSFQIKAVALLVCLSPDRGRSVQGLCRQVVSQSPARHGRVLGLLARRWFFQSHFEGLSRIEGTSWKTFSDACLIIY